MNIMTYAKKWILAIDTSSHYLNVALVCMETDQVYSYSASAQRQQARLLHSVVENLIAEAQISFENIALLAVTVGPGSYTGIRIGMSAVLGYKMALKIPAIGVSSLEVCAAQARDHKQSHTDEKNLSTAQMLIIPSIPAHSGQIYVQCFKADLTAVEKPSCILAEDLSTYIQQNATLPDQEIITHSGETSLCPIQLAKQAFIKFNTEGEVPLKASYVSRLPYKTLDEQSKQEI